MIRMVRHVFGLTLGTFALLALVIPAAADDARSGTVEIFSSTIAPVIGGTRGDGTLTLPDGRTYKFSVESLKLFSFGASRMHAEGDVSNMKSIRDFEGTYVVVEAGVTVGAGVGGLVMKNENGVVMKLTALQQGVNLTVGAGSMAIKVKSHLF